MTRYLLTLACLLGTAASAQDGQIDTSFGLDGFATDLQEARPIRLADLAVSPSDEAVYVGWSGRTETEVFVGRVSEDGTPDASFGSNGHVILPVEGTGETLRAVAVRADGHILATGQAVSGDGTAPATRLLTVQLEPSGRPETVAVIDLGESSRGEGIAVFSDGAFLAVSLLDSQSCALVRLDANGAVDSSFGIDGQQVLSVGSPCEAADVVLTETGVALAGTLADGTGTVFVTQVTRDGEPDPRFGTAGLVRLPFDSSRNKASSLAVGPGGDLIVGGLSRKGSTVGPLLLRLDRSGAPLETFGHRGMYWSATAPEDGIYAEPPGVAALPDGRVVFATTTSPTLRLTVGGVTPEGERDLDFGTDGFTTASSSVSNFSYGRGIAVDSKGRTLVGGEAIVSGTLHKLVISRLTGSVTSTSSSALPAPTGSLLIAPNPAVDRTRIRIPLDRPAMVQAVVMDSLGRQLDTLYDGSAEAGDLDLEWDASGAAPGLYIVQMRVDGRPVVGTLTVAR